MSCVGPSIIHRTVVMSIYSFRCGFFLRFRLIDIDFDHRLHSLFPAFQQWHITYSEFRCTTFDVSVYFHFITSCDLFFVLAPIYFRSVLKNSLMTPVDVILKEGEHTHSE